MVTERAEPVTAREREALEHARRRLAAWRAEWAERYPGGIAVPRVVDADFEIDPFI
jgi:hypothetical protein